MIPVINTKFHMKSKAGIEIRIPINNKVTIITGDSATGKTKMLKYLSDLLDDKHEIVSSTVNINRVYVCLDASKWKKDIDKNIKESLIFMDRVDRVNDDKELIDFITNSPNLFVLCMHNEIPQCGYSLKSMLGLKHDGVNYTAYQLFKNHSDFMNNRGGELI